MSKRSYYGFQYYTPTTPIDVKGGIKAKNKRGAFGESWWAKRWIATLESFNIGARLSRGKSYARRGQVKSIDIKKGEVRGEVQGSSTIPYKVTIEVKTLTEANWRKLAKLLSNEVVFLAKLLAGEMPEEIESAFKDANLSLFPNKVKDLVTTCNCPDWSNPCKHIAAVYYLLGEEFDRDPFLIFKLRGLTRDELLDFIGGEAINRVDLEEKEVIEPEPLQPDAKNFWGGEEHSEMNFSDTVIPIITAALPVRLGGFPFWRGEEGLIDAIKPVYTSASKEAIRIILGDA